MESILKSIKQLLGIDEAETSFDVDIIIHINSAFADLHQMGVGPDEPFSINDDDITWDAFTEENAIFNSVKTYVYLKVKLIFDPPANSSVLSAMERQARELEWRLTVSASNKAMEENEEDE